MRAVAVVLAAVTITALSGQAPAKKRIAVFDFDNAAVQGAVSSLFFSTAAPNLGKAAADLLVNRLVQDGSASVIERAAIDKLLAEQNLSNSDRFDPATAAKIGRILGVDAIILGSITHYDYEDKTTGGGGNRFGGFGGSGMTTKHDIRALVQISARVVSPDTAEVMTVSQGAGEIVRKGVKIDIRDTSRTNPFAQASANPIMNEAMDKAVVQLGGQLGQGFPKLPPRNPVIDGLVADANGAGRLILNVGGNHGVKQGDRLQVWRAGKEVRDPATGAILLRDDTLLGEAVVNTVNDISSIADFKGAEPVKTGDLVKSPPKKP
jgi:curli biogenesis system outer membrane secretion channel CsgG